MSKARSASLISQPQLSLRAKHGVGQVADCRGGDASPSRPRNSIYHVRICDVTIFLPSGVSPERRAAG